MGARVALVAGTTFAYITAFFLLPPESFGALRPVNALLVVVTALFFGMRTGLGMGLFAVLLNLGLYSYDDILAPTVAQLIGNVLSIVMGLALCVVVGWGRDLALALEAEVTRREAAERRRDELTAHLVHDLKNPLTGIGGYTQLLQEELAGTPQAEALQYIHTATERMGRMLLNLLDVNRAEDGALRPAFESLELATLVDDIQRVLRPHVEERQVELQVLRGDGSARAWADPELLRRTLLNLVENALRYTPARGVVRLEVGGSGEEVELAVRDEGPGVPSGFEERIFDKYARVDEVGGVAAQANQGLGLHFCRLAVDAQGGRIWVEPNAPVGSVFRVRIPSAPPEALLGLVSGSNRGPKGFVRA